MSPGKKKICSRWQRFPFLKQRFSGFSALFDFSGRCWILHPWFPTSLSLTSWSGQSWPFLLSRSARLQLDGGAGQSRGCRDEERISWEEDDDRLLPLPSGLAAEESRLILSSVDGGNPAEQKNGFCHTSRTSNGINVGVSAERRLIAWRASQHANVMHG